MDKVFFKEGGGGHLSACLNFASNPFNLYATGYLRAGNILVDYIVEKGHYMDTLVYPIVFNYRQYLELKLKEIIWRGRELLDKDGRYPTHHKLNDLWNTAKQLMDLTWEGVDRPEEYVVADALMAEFDEVDRLSDAFRFPEDRDGKQHLKGMKYLNLPNVKEVIQKVSEFLDGAAMGIGIYLDHKHEMMAEGQWS